MRPELEESLRSQAKICAEMGSPIYASLLERSAEDVARGGPIADLIADWEGHPVLDALALRWMGALHYLALSDAAPALAAQLPSTGGVFDEETAFAIARELARDRADELRPMLRDGVQTNEVRRCCALHPGALRFAATTALPLRLLEIGSSAGLNLAMDRYGYDLGGVHQGLASSHLQLTAAWEGRAPPGGTLEIASREGCDVDPFDVTVTAECLRLQSFVWPDQAERLERLRFALDLARRDPPVLTRARAGDWLATRLAAPVPERATLLFHSVMWWYVPEEERERIVGLVEAAGDRADETCPLGWLRMESTGPDACELRLRRWPGGHEYRLARVHHHGAWIEWNEEERT